MEQYQLWGSEQIRQTCIYFKPFFDQTTFLVLPVKILSFSAQTSNGNTDLRWVATNEKRPVKLYRSEKYGWDKMDRPAINETRGRRKH